MSSLQIVVALLLSFWINENDLFSFFFLTPEKQKTKNKKTTKNLVTITEKKKSLKRCEGEKRRAKTSAEGGGVGEYTNATNARSRKTTRASVSVSLAKKKEKRKC